MVSVYRNMNAATLAIFLQQEKTLSAFTFATSDEVSFVPPKAQLGVLEAFATDKSLNKAFNDAYKKKKESSIGPVDGAAHTDMQANALRTVIEDNREKFPPGEFKIVIANGEGVPPTEIVIREKVFYAGQIFKKEQAKRDEDFKIAAEAKEAEKQRNDARTTTPADAALKTLLSIRSLEGKEGDTENQTTDAAKEPERTVLSQVVKAYDLV